MVRVIFAALLAFAASAQAAPVAGNWEGEAASDLWPTFLRIEIGPGEHGQATMFVLGQTIDLGQTKDASMLDSTIGDGADALKVVARVDGDHLAGTMSQSGKTFAFNLQPIPSYSPTNDRVMRWSRDLDAIRDRVLTFDRSFDSAEKVKAKQAIERLRVEIPRLSDDAIVVRIARIAALANNAHTRLYILRNRTEVRRMPIRAWWFGKELRVVRAAPGYVQYLGCRVDRVGDLPPSAAKARLDDLFSGSATWRTYMSGYSLTSSDVLYGAGIIPAADSVRYQFGDCGTGARTVSIPALPLAKSSKPLESWWDLAPHYAGASDDWKQLLSGTAAPPLYLRHPDKNYWFDDQTADRLFYVQYNRAADAPDEALADFSARAAKAMAAAHPRAVVVDLRFNTGGNGTITPKLVDAVNQAPTGTPVYVITGRSTFSAGIVAAALLRQARPVKIVGEPVGDALDFWSEGGNIILPYSGLYVHFANGAHSLSPKPCPTKDYCDDMSVTSVQPDILAPPTWSSYVARRDPAMDAIERNLKRRQ